MNRYTVNFICRDKNGHDVIRSEEFFWSRVDEVIEMVKLEWAGWDVEILWAGIRLNDGV